MGKVVSSIIKPVASLAGSVLSPVTSLLGIHNNNRASDTAANYQTTAMQKAQQLLQPYADTGTQANTMIQNQLSSGALGGNFNPGDLTKDPGYQFRLQQGQQALDRRAAAGGNYFSGGALKEAQNFGQGLADQTYNDAYNRWLDQQRNTYNILSGQSNQGLGAAADMGKYDAGIGDVNSNNSINKNKNQNEGLARLLSGGF